VIDTLLVSHHPFLPPDLQASSLPPSIELPASLRHGILITPPVKAVDNLRRFLNTEPKPEWYAPFQFHHSSHPHRSTLLPVALAPGWRFSGARMSFEVFIVA
jgi:hypothetical protein